MRYIQRLYKDVNKGNEIYVNKGNISTKAKQRCKQRQWDILQRLNKDVNKGNEIYTKAKQRCKQRQWDIYKG